MGYESASGVGSSVRYTTNLRRELPNLISAYGIARVFDAPCGDFNWMKLVLAQVQVDYLGADIVQEVVDQNNLLYLSETTRFVKLDLTRDCFPSADLMICRDCLFHLSYGDIRYVLTNFANADIPYLLTTTHKNKDNFRNQDVATGDFRLIDLFSQPFNLPNSPLMRIDDWEAPEPEREMCLFTREQVLSAIAPTFQ